jgi:hypothetical protein
MKFLAEDLKMRLRSKTRRSAVFTIKSGPTESGLAQQPPSHPPSPYSPVGGEMLPVDKLSIFLSQYWLLIILLIIFPVALAHYRKRLITLKFLTPLVFRILDLTRFF